MSRVHCSPWLSLIFCHKYQAYPHNEELESLVKKMVKKSNILASNWNCRSPDGNCEFHYNCLNYFRFHREPHHRHQAATTASDHHRANKLQVKGLRLIFQNKILRLIFKKKIFKKFLFTFWVIWHVWLFNQHALQFGKYWAQHHLLWSLCNVLLISVFTKQSYAKCQPTSGEINKISIAQYANTGGQALTHSSSYPFNLREKI